MNCIQNDFEYRVPIYGALIHNIDDDSYIVACTEDKANLDKYAKDILIAAIGNKDEKDITGIIHDQLVYERLQELAKRGFTFADTNNMFANTLEYTIDDNTCNHTWCIKNRDTVLIPSIDIIHTYNNKF